MAERTRSYEFSQQTDTGGSVTTAYQDIDGQIHVIEGDPAAVAPLQITKSFYQNSPLSPIELDDVFSISRGELGRVVRGPDYSFDTLTFKCTSVKVSDEMHDLTGGRKRLWRVTVTGKEYDEARPENDGSTLRRSVALTQSLNGTVERTVAGSLMILRSSTTARKQITITAYSDTSVPPLNQGDLYSYGDTTFTIINVQSSEIHVEKNGTLIKTLWQHTIDGEA